MLAHWIKWSGDFVAQNAIFSLLLFLERCTLLVFHSDITPLSSSLLLSHSLSLSPPGSWAQCMLSDRASESYRRGCGCHIASGARARCREERGPFSKSTHPCKNDQSHEFANRESLADQWRQRQIMREIRCMCVWGGGEGKRGRMTKRTEEDILKGIEGKEKWRKIERAWENGLVKTKEQVSLDRQSCHERMNVNIGVCSDRKERREERRERNGPCFFPSFTLCVPRLKASRSFRQQRSKVHVWGSSCQARAGPGEVVTSKGGGGGLQKCLS